MKNSIKNGLEKSISYQEYRGLVTGLLKEEKSTGLVQSDEIFNYSKLNNSRMKRLDKTFHLSEQSKKVVEGLPEKYIWLVITEGWCGDAAQILPVVNKIAEVSENIDLRIVLRDENENLMNHFLTNGGKAIPKLILLNSDTNEVLDDWGPRPTDATKMVVEQKEKFGGLDADFKKELQHWYNTSKGVAIENDLLDLLNVTQSV